MQKDPKKNKENLESTEAIEKLKELIKHESICMFCTKLDDQHLKTRPMSTRKVDDEGNIWFMSSIKSGKNKDIKLNDSVQLLYSNPGSSEYLSVLGKATIVLDRDKIEELWTSWAKAWFQNGKEDEDISLIKIAPKTSYYWDTKSNKMISMIQMLASMVGGPAPDDGVEGKLKV